MEDFFPSLFYLGCSTYYVGGVNKQFGTPQAQRHEELLCVCQLSLPSWGQFGAEINSVLFARLAFLLVSPRQDCGLCSCYEKLQCCECQQTWRSLQGGGHYDNLSMSGSSMNFFLVKDGSIFAGNLWPRPCKGPCAIMSAIPWGMVKW